MNLRKPVPIIMTIALLALIFIWLDHILAGNIPENAALKAFSGFFSLVGDGAVLFGVSALIYLSGYFKKKTALKETGREGVLAILLASAAVHLIKAAFERPRIAHGADAMGYLLQNTSVFDYSGRFNSFPSGHSAASFALAYVLAKKFPRFAVFFYAAAVLVAIARVGLGSHYPTDVLAGALLGLGAGYLILAKTGLREKWITAGLGLLIVFLSFFKTGGFLLFDVDEAVFSAAAREMVETGNLITPTYNFEPRYDKPILIYWFMSAAFKLFGTTEFAARFTSSLFGVLLSGMTFLFVKRLTGLTTALVATLALFVNLEFFVYSHSAVTDMTLAFFITASIFSFYMGTIDGKKRWFLGFWAASALAVLTKGAVGLLFPAVIAILYLALSKNLHRSKELFRPSYIGLFILIGAPWFIAQLMINGWDFFNAFIVKHHIKRYSGVISSHGGPLYYYIGVLLLGFFPWVAMLPSGVYRGFKQRHDAASSLYLLGAIWFIFVLVFFSVSRTKLPNYIFPLFPPAAILAGLVISDMAEKRAGRAPAYLLAAIAFVFASALFILPSLSLKMDVYLPPRFFYTLGAAFAAVALLTTFSFRKTLPSFLCITGVMVLIIVFLRLYALPPANIYLQKTLYDYSRYARAALPPDGVLATYEINKPSISFYSRRKIVKADKSDDCSINEYSKRTTTIVITKASAYEDLKDYNLRVIDSSGEYMLLGTDGLPPFKAR
ncbi:MAG TPA: hypothetical protein DDW94_05110 [Deltaproteobacteria bacterium]|nr:MAG: hypothetical protein A2Z79_11080 [Deltaproteobacteria bacterium GWA2_55_82]OGQ64418.1 MAG: hypothetical protein A3I81_02985 [Deltaproteobacteria bacterium RIFCSPLOWO2_02_FULL_55_12]OIJ72797.1 MAG: hypothetical protein A2V21_300125 [Deltaproteobacteria bacterium GWC2_55_46]HBG46352.1 hypothetical protein [Deltaproteobacteria bacterium]HCY11573.1 hypothetical protein [Deltaproteobacteria bacterium]